MSAYRRRKCLPPLAIARNYGVRWMRRRLSIGGFDEVPKDDSEVDNFAMDDDGVLYIQGLVLEDAGMYTCFKNGAQEVTYFIGVENAVDRRMVQESWTNLRDMPAKPKTLALNNLYMFTQWSDWTECNLCNQRGQRKRIGMCMVKKMVSSQKTRPKEAIILVRYPEGVPCRSALLPQFITNKTDLRPSEFMVGYCFMDCTTLVPVTYITDMDGKTVEVVLTGKGRKSLRGTAPPMPKEVERSTKYVDDGGRITLQCVASEEEDKKQPIRWQNGSQMINELTLERESKGRVYVDMDNQLVIKHATKYDRGVYSCWKNLVRLSIIRLMVSAPTDVSILSIISGFCFVVFVFMMIYLGVHMVKFSSLKPVDKVFRHHAKLRKKGKNGEGKKGKGKKGKGKKGRK